MFSRSSISRDVAPDFQILAFVNTLLNLQYHIRGNLGVFSYFPKVISSALYIIAFSFSRPFNLSINKLFTSQAYIHEFLRFLYLIRNIDNIVDRDHETRIHRYNITYYRMEVMREVAEASLFPDGDVSFVSHRVRLTFNSKSCVLFPCSLDSSLIQPSTL